MPTLASFEICCDCLQTICCVVTLLVFILSVLFVIKQVDLLKQQTKHLSTSLYNQTYHAIYDRMIQVDQFFIEHPEIKAYVYGNDSWPEDPILQQQVLSACEMMADLFQKLVELHSHGRITNDAWLGWNRYMRDVYAHSDSFRRFFDANGWWYTVGLSSILSPSAEFARMQSRLPLDLPTTDEIKLDAALWNIYEEAFPADEKEPPEVIYSTLAKNVGYIIRARYLHDYDTDTPRETSPYTIGFAEVHVLSEPKVKFLVYLGVARSVRGHGIGTQLVTEVCDPHIVNLPPWADADCTVLEVDDPDLTDDPIERKRRNHRLAFFEKAGFRILLRHYWQPALSNTKSPVQMILMAYPKNKVYSTPDIVKAIYKEKYGNINNVPTDTLQELYNRILLSGFGT